LTQYTGKESYRAIRRKLCWTLFFSTGFAAYAYAAAHPEATERRYSRGLYPLIARHWFPVTSSVRFSIAELIVYALVFLALVRVLRGLAGVVRERAAAGRFFYLLDLLMSGAVFFSALCFLAIATWGLNYNRLPFAETAGLDVGEAPVSELAEACGRLAERANALRGAVREDGQGVMALSVPMRNTLDRAKDGFWAAEADFPTLADIEPGRPKPVLASKLMSYSGITGIFFPLTGEANVNTNITDAEAPFTICHELAHQLGYAREDEANFIAWLACKDSPYEDYRYSGELIALTHLLNALRGQDESAWSAVRATCSPAVERDLAAMGLFWQRYEGPVSEISTTINDTYLKVNRQPDGVQSYGRMADLVIAYMRDEQ
jgi:hypothetical protein